MYVCIREAGSAGGSKGVVSGCLQLHSGAEVLLSKSPWSHLWSAGAVCPWCRPTRHQHHCLNSTSLLLFCPLFFSYFWFSILCLTAKNHQDNGSYFYIIFLLVTLVWFNLWALCLMWFIIQGSKFQVVNIHNNPFEIIVPKVPKYQVAFMHHYMQFPNSSAKVNISASSVHFSLPPFHFTMCIPFHQDLTCQT